MSRYLFIDWGTSNLKAFLVGPSSLPKQFKGAVGIKGLPRDKIISSLDHVCCELGALKDEKIIISGMIGSSIGWEVVDYLPCPANAYDIAQNLITTRIGDREVQIVRGLSHRDEAGRPDVLRGEEVEILGALSLKDAPKDRLTLVLPGTHSKWVNCKNGAIERFKTFMTGELFDVLAQHSILKPSIDGMGSDDEHFERGVVDGSSESLGLDRLFSVRAAGLVAGLRPHHAASYLQGLLIGGEISAMRFSLTRESDDVQIVAGESLSRLYMRAFQILGIGATTRNQNELLLSGAEALMRHRDE